MVEPIQKELVVVGAGPGGYAAAFYAADKGMDVLLVEKHPRLGGVCLNRGCIPSKAYLHASKLITEANESSFRGITFDKPKIDTDQMREWKESILDKLGDGVSGLAKARNVEVMNGRGHFEDSQTLRVETDEGQKFVRFKNAIIAVGSIPTMPANFDLGNQRIMTSDEALEIPDVPQSLLVIGGGYIGLELGTVYHTLGSEVVLVEALPDVLSGSDPDLKKYVRDYADKNFKDVRAGTKVQKMSTSGKQIKVAMQTGDQEPIEEKYDRVLVCVGRTPNTNDLGLKNTKIQLDNKGFVQVDKQQRTGDPNIYAIGDVAGGALLAHKAHKEGRIAVDVITGEHNEFADIIVPAVVYTDPELAWCGLTELEAKEKNIDVEIAKFPWSSSGRALTFDRPDGFTKIIVEPETERVLGVGIVGHGAGDMISEGALAIEMGATARDLAEVIHPHPTLSETIMECAERYYGFATHAVGPKRTPKP